MKGGKQLDHMVLGCARWDLDPKNLPQRTIFLLLQ